MNVWTQILEKLKSEVSAESFEIFFQPTQLERQSEKEVIVRVPNKYYKEWITTQYSEMLQTIQQSLQLDHFRLKFIVDCETDSNGYLKVETLLPADEDFLSVQEMGKLNPKYRFDTFVVGACNEFAHAVSLSVSENPFFSYNPFYLYGGVGLGKTHLMHAIGHAIKVKFSHIKLVYMSSERFMNELIASLRYNRVLQFREKYRRIDVLMIDDIQFLANRDRTQEEFFHTFNALHENQKQIIVSSDCLPKELKNIEDRLKSRFEWGMTADLQPPELEMRMAILKKKAESDSVFLPEDVVYYIASNLKSNVRELEGALIRLIAYSSLRKESLDLPLAKRVLSHIHPTEAGSVTIGRIQKVVSDFFKLKASDLQSKSHSREITLPRHIAMYLCKQMTGCSLPKIGSEFGGKDHTTVLHAVKKIAEQKDRDTDLRSTINRLINLLS